MITYLATNPYVGINLVSNREVLVSNFGNSLAMYEVDRVVEGAVRLAQLACEGATAPVVILGVIGMVLCVRQYGRASLPLLIPALVFALQFALIGAGKPDEYGRFSIFYSSALAVCCAV